ncbi:hypothetical protein EAF00_010958 [Botryotinia globosa]|nr:hypothetical protein EAF00_010958 [Botryotinia globosa]
MYNLGHSWRGGGSQALPHFSKVDGVSRVLRNEYNQMRFFVVAFAFLDSLRSIKSKSLTLHETESRENNGRLEAERIIPADTILETTTAYSSPYSTRRQQYFNVGSTIFSAQNAGSCDGFFFRNGGQADILSSTEIEVENMAFGLNYTNLLAAIGKIDHGSFSNECAGIVVRVGKGCESFEPGNRVFGWGPIFSDPTFAWTTNAMDC